MTKYEFLQKLREALENDLSGAVVQDNINYYDRYIMEEVQKGSSEADVIAALGDPWMLARTIIDAPGGAGETNQTTYYEESQSNYGQEEDQYENPNAHIHVFGLDTWWKKVLLVLGIVMVVVSVIAIITGVISFLAPILIPVFIVMIIIRLIGGHR
ncbi:MAG: DUF1700 domain-containing protein [Hespellia sp.]|nr:DUF1700 domain-containing protein [Hespellia sp.]